MSAAHPRSCIPRLMLVTDRHRSLLPLPVLVAAAVAGGCDAVQVREKDLSRPKRQALVDQLRAATPGGVSILVNGDAELAAADGIGLHLPEHDLDPQDARARLGPDVLIGRSVHGPAAAARTTDVDYLLAGNVFPTGSHPGRPGLGLGGLAKIVASTSLPVLAIGGIVAANAGEVIGAGAHGVAVVGGIASAADPRDARERAAAFRRAIEQAFHEPTGVRNVPDRMPAAPAETITVEVNGKPTELAPETTVSGFLADRALQDRLVVVELNGRILGRSEFDQTVIGAGDRLEVVHFVGGG